MTDLDLDRLAIHKFLSPGPVATSWYQSNARCAFIMGPIGSAKTTTAIFKRARHALRMPRCNDGVIRSKWVVVRSDFRTLEKTTLASWLQWFPKDLPGAEWKGGNDRPATHTIRFNTKRGPVEMITEFAALGDHRIEDVLRGWEGDGGWLSEADQMKADAKFFLLSRFRPFMGGLLTDQAKRDAMPRQLIGDLNAPDVDSWIYDEFVEHHLEDHVLFRQPSGLSADAENISNLPKNYYVDLEKENKHRKWWVDRFIHNKFGYSRDGKPVYECFDQDRHVAAHEIEPDPELDLIIGLDGGGSPAAVLVQPRPTGQIVVTDELVPGHGFGPRRFAELLADLLMRRYAGVRRIILFADPATQWGADQEGGELSWIETVSAVLGLPIRVPDTNETGIRLEAVSRPMMTTIDGRAPGLIVSPRCRMIIRGFAYLYRYKRQKVGDQISETPDKNEASHPHDALQYALLGHFGRAGVIREAARASRVGWAGRGDAPKPVGPRLQTAARLFR